jgi:hypothetical protein
MPGTTYPNGNTSWLNFCTDLLCNVHYSFRLLGHNQCSFAEGVLTGRNTIVGTTQHKEPITVTAWSKAWTLFARSSSGIVGSNPTWGMDACVRLFCVCVVLCVGSGLATDWFPVQGVVLNVYRIKKLKSGQGPRKGCRAIDREHNTKLRYRTYDWHFRFRNCFNVSLNSCYELSTPYLRSFN